MKISFTLILLVLFDCLFMAQQGDYTANWSAGTNMPSPTRYHGAGCMWVNATKDTAKLICFGGDIDGNGNASNLTNIYNLAANTWSIGQNLSFGRYYGFACVIGDSAYYFGGVGGPIGWTGEVNTVDIYSIRTNTMTVGTVLPTTMADGRAVPYQDSLIYIIGGMTGGTQNATTNVYLFNRQTVNYRPTTSLPAPRCGFASVTIGDTIYVVCGGTGYNTGLTNTLYIGAISQSNRANINWTTGTNYPGTSLWRFYAEKWGCKGFITGCGSAGSFTTSSECYVYNTNNHTWQVQLSAPVPTAAYFSGSASFGVPGITKWVVASGLTLVPPYSIPNVQIYTDSSCFSPPLDFCQGFSSTSFPPYGWSISPPSNSSWSWVPVSGFGLGTGSVKYDMTNAPQGVYQTLILPQIIPTYNGVLYFDFAACDANIPTYDSLIISSAIVNLGFNTLVRLGAPWFPNPPSSCPNPFVPGAGDWRRMTYNLPNYTTRIQIQVKSGSGGNPIYLDSICVINWEGVQNSQNGIPKIFVLSQNYPNPFNPETMINYELPFPVHVKLVIYNYLGKEVTTLVNEKQQQGRYQVNWNASEYSSGVYFYRLQTESFSETKKMVLIK